MTNGIREVTHQHSLIQGQEVLQEMDFQGSLHSDHGRWAKAVFFQYAAKLGFWGKFYLTCANK